MAATLADRRMILIGAFAEAAPAGYVSGLVMRSFTRAGDTAMLDDLLVAPRFRGRGLVRELMRRFRETAQAEGEPPLAMYSGTDRDNLPCARAFLASGAVPEAPELYVEYQWPTDPGAGR